jgi:hypothetical protein
MMKRVLFALGLSMLLAPLANQLTPAASAQQVEKHPGHEPVTICHRTGSDSNPYVVITTDDAAIVEAHIGSEGNPPHPPKDGRADFIIRLGGTEDDCKKG